MDCQNGGLREQEPAQPVAEGVQGAAGDGDAGALKTHVGSPREMPSLDPVASWPASLTSAVLASTPVDQPVG